MLQAHGLSYEPSPIAGKLFDNVSLSILAGEKVALVGNNGTGKTKLLEILAGIVQPGAGQVVFDGLCRIGYLSQDVDFDFQGSLAEFLASCMPPSYDGDSSEVSRHRRACARIGLDPGCLDREYRLLSVGERVRACLARMLLDEPTLLLLDEPTNHLDIDGRRWFADFLGKTRQACLMVSHDRAVINEVAARTLLLSEGSLTDFAGGYDDLVSARRSAHARQLGEYERQREEEQRIAQAARKVAEHAARMSKRPRSRTYDPKAKAFYRAKEARLQARAKGIKTRVTHAVAERVEKPFTDEAIAISFHTRPLRHSDALSIRDLRLVLARTVLVDKLSLTVGPGERVAVVGPNGAGKTTLFRLCLDVRGASGTPKRTFSCSTGLDTERLSTGTADSRTYQGDIRWSDDSVPAYLSQERALLGLGATVLETLGPTNAAEEHFARTLLARLRMRGDAVDKPMRVLSVGERTKVELTAILMTEANVLLLDEPTNHLDIDSLEALEEALHQFTGAILFTSHDQAFIKRVATSVVALSG